MLRRGRARNLLAGTAILAAVVAAADAAELPTMRSAPPKHAKSCRVGGMEGYYLAGSTVCVRVSGYISGGVETGKGWSSK
jgi:hypothetical protein